MEYYSALKGMNNQTMKRQKDRTLKDELPRSVGAQCVTRDQWRNNSRKNEGMEPKNVQTTTQLHSSHTLAKECSKFSKPGFNNMWTENFQILKLVLEKAEKLENSQHLLDHRKSKRVPEKHLFLLYRLYQNPWLCGSQETVENSERDGNTRSPDLPFEKFVCRSGSNS